MQLYPTQQILDQSYPKCKTHAKKIIKFCISDGCTYKCCARCSDCNFHDHKVSKDINIEYLVELVNQDSSQSQQLRRVYLGFVEKLQGIRAELNTLIERYMTGVFQNLETRLALPKPLQIGKLLPEGYLNFGAAEMRKQYENLDKARSTNKVWPKYDSQIVKVSLESKVILSALQEKVKDLFETGCAYLGIQGNTLQTYKSYLAEIESRIADLPIQADKSMPDDKEKRMNKIKEAKAKYTENKSSLNPKTVAEIMRGFDEAISINPFSPLSYFQKAFTAYDCKQYSIALVNYSIYLDQQPTYDINAYNNKGMCLSVFKRQEDALKCYDKVNSISLKFAKAYLNKCIIYFQQCRYMEAQVCVQKCLEIEPDSKLGKEYQQRLMQYFKRTGGNA